MILVTKRVCVFTFIKLRITAPVCECVRVFYLIAHKPAESDPAILVNLFYSSWSSQGWINDSYDV